VFGNVLTARHRHGNRSLLRTLFPGKRERAREKQLRDEAALIIDKVGLTERINAEAGFAVVRRIAAAGGRGGARCRSAIADAG